MLVFVISCLMESPKQHFEEESSNITPPSFSCNFPRAEAGQSQILNDSDGDGVEPVYMNGSGSSEDVVTHEWSEVIDLHSESLGTGQTLYYRFSTGIHLVILTVTNNCGYKDKDALFVNVKTPESPQAPLCNPPKAEAKVNDKDEAVILITEASSLFLDGSGSYDPDGDTLYYIWTAVCQDVVEFNPNRYVASPRISLPFPRDYHFILQVNDGTNFSEIDMIKITVKQPDAWVDSTLPDDIPDEFKFKTIQGAIDFIDNKRDIYDESEKIVAIAPGLYKEKVIVKPHIYLIGLKSERASLPHIVNFVNEGEAVITLDDHVTINNLDILVMKKGPNDGVSSEKSAINVYGENVRVQNCKIQNSYSDGISLKEDSYAEVTDTLLADIAGEGIVGEKNSRLKVEMCRILYTGGSGIWTKDAYSVEVRHNIIYYPGWHGLDINCKNVTIIEHCTIGDFGRWYEEEEDSPRCGIFLSGSGSFTIKSNLIEIQDKPELSGINIYSNFSSECLKFNYIYSIQPDNKYYDGNVTIESVDPTNLPNIDTKTTSDPHLIDPYNGDFRLDQESPVLGLGEKDTDPGANGDILRPYAPTPPKLSLPLHSQLVDPNDLIFRWERSEDPDGDSDKIKYSITIYEDGDKDKDDFADDVLVFLGWDIRSTSINFRELKPLEKELELGKRYWWCVQAIDEDGHKSNRRKGEWRCFDTNF